MQPARKPARKSKQLGDIRRAPQQSPCAERRHANDERAGIECGSLRDAPGVDSRGRVQAHSHSPSREYTEADGVTERVCDERCEQNGAATNLRPAYFSAEKS